MIIGIAIFALLSAMFMPALFMKRKSAGCHNWDDKVCQRHLKTIGQILTFYHQAYNTYPDKLSQLTTEGFADDSNFINSDNSNKNIFMCPAQTSYARGTKNLDCWTTYIYRKPKKNLKEDYMVVHCLGYPHFRWRCELWMTKNGKFETRMRKYKETKNQIKITPLEQNSALRKSGK